MATKSAARWRRSEAWAAWMRRAVWVMNGAISRIADSPSRVPPSFLALATINASSVQRPMRAAPE